MQTKLLNMDPLGATTLIGAVCCLLLALQWGGSSYPWRSVRVIVLLVLSGLFLIGFCLLQWKLGEIGTIPPRILRQRSVLMGCIYTMLLSMSNYTVSHDELSTDYFSIETKYLLRMAIICLSTSRGYKVCPQQLVAFDSYRWPFRKYLPLS